MPPLDVQQRYTLKEAQRYLRTSHASLHHAITAGTIATLKSGKRRYVPGSEIARLSQLPNAVTEPMPEAVFNTTARRYEKELHQLHRKIEELEREIALLLSGTVG